MLKIRFLGVVFLVMCASAARGQFLMDMIDTTTNLGKGMISIYKKFDHLRISGYMQPQFQAASGKGFESYAGGNFAPRVSNRFMLRRGRVRFDYAHFNQRNLPTVQFVFQFDGTERGVFIRDFWGRYFENKWQLFSLSMGMFARPFGYEINLASSDRESPERGRMSQILMKTERDLGAMLSFEPCKRGHPLRHLKVDVGVFNGPGLSSTADYDNYKDLIARVALKPVNVGKRLLMSAGVSMLRGGFLQNTAVQYRVGHKMFIEDSSLSNIGREAPRRYYGADVQLKLRHRWGFTEIRGEYIRGTQTANASTTETPGALLAEPSYIRHFDGAYLYFLQNIFSVKHQLCVKYDWYDPNTDVKGHDIGAPGANVNATNIKYSTLGMGYIYYCNENVKLVAWYDFVKNERTLLPGYTTDLRDNVMTLRLQFRF